MVRVIEITFVTCLIALPVAAQNLLVNPGFDNVDQLNGWTCSTANGIASWSPEDRAGSATSGSMQHDVTATSNNRYLWCSQCVPVDEFEAYIASMWVFWPNDPDVTQDGSPRIEIDYHASATCDSFLQLGDIQVGFPFYDTWNFLSTNPTTAPSGAQSALLFVITWQDLADDAVRARIDDVDFHSTNSIIFRDGFESGNTIAWAP